MAEISEAVFFHHPSAPAGQALFLFGIWYSFQKRAVRMVCGGEARCSWRESRIFSPTRITNGIFSYDVPKFSGISLAGSFQFALPGFYIGLAVTFLCGIGFLLFARKAA